MPLRAVITSTNVVFSLKTFAAAMLAYWIALCFDLPKPFWAVATVYIIAHPLSGAITSKALYRLLGTMIGGIMTVVLVPNLVNAPVLLSGAIALWVGFCLFVSLLDRTPRSYVFLLGGYTVLLAGLPLVDAPATAFDIAVARVEEIGLGIICSALVNRLVLPSHAGPVLLARVDAWLDNASRLTFDTLSGAMDKAKVAGEWRRLAADAVDMRAFTTHVSYDGSNYRELTGLLHGLQQRQLALLPVVSTLADIRSTLEQLKTPAAGNALTLVEEIGGWVSEHSVAGARAQPLRDKAEGISPAKSSDPTWESLTLVSAGQRLLELIDIWEDCQVLRTDIELERISPASQHIISQAGKPQKHLDYGMALVTAFATMLCFSLATLFWILSGWTDGVTVAQLSAVFCCLMATMDDPVPALRKFLPVVMYAAVAAFVYNFAILPRIDGFLPLAAALGLFLIPAGICLAVPSLFLIGLGLCVDLPLMLTLQARLATDFPAFANSNIATVIAIVWAMVVCGLVKSGGAEASGRRLLRAGWSQVYEIASRPDIDTGRVRDRMLDMLGLFGARIAAASPDSDLAAGDLIRDLRVGMALARLRDLGGDLPGTWNSQIDGLLAEAARFYRAKSLGKRSTATNLIEKVDFCLVGLAREKTGQLCDEARMVLAALRLTFDPAIAPPVLVPPPSQASTSSIAA